MAAINQLLNFMRVPRKMTIMFLIFFYSSVFNGFPLKQREISLFFSFDQFLKRFCRFYFLYGLTARFELYCDMKKFLF